MFRTIALLAAFFSASLSIFAAISPPSPLVQGIVGLPYPPSSSSPNPFIRFTSNNSTNARNLVWSASGLPRGLTLNRQGVLSGKPAASGNFTLNIFLKSGRTTIDSGNFTISIVDTPPPVISGPFILPGGQFDQRYQNNLPNNGFRLSAASGYPFSPNSIYPTGFYWQLVPGNLPSQRLPQGMTLNANGVISGTPVWPKPPIPSTLQTYRLQVRATDFLSKSSTANFTLVSNLLN